MNDTPPSNSHSRRFNRFVRAIYATDTELISAERAEELMLLCAAEKLSLHEIPQRYPDLWRYLEAFPEEQHEFELMMRSAQDLDNGALEKPAWLPPVPRQPGPSLQKQVENFAAFLFPGFRSSAAGASQRSAGPGDESPQSATISIGPDLDVILTILLQPEHDYILLVNIAPLHEVPLALEGTLVRLINKEQMPVETVLDAAGGAVFEQVQPGNYSLELYLGQPAKRIDGIQFL